MAPEISLRAEYAKRLLYNHVMQKYNSRHDLSSHDRDLSSRPKSDVASDAPKRKISIIGAGTAGLQVAMALLYCGFSDIDIFEAADTVGGRARTIHYPVDPEHGCPHNCYDAGAMRIPKIPAMESMLHMVNWLGLENSLVDYTYNAGNEPSMYLYQHNYNIDNTTFDDNIAPRVSSFFKDFNKAFEAFVSGTLDNQSTRMRLMTGCRMSYDETVVAERADTSTGLFAPRQFKNLYTQFTKPLCGKKLMICGEAIRAHHAWISGALESAYNAVLAWFLANEWHHLAKSLRDSPFGCSEGKHTQEIDEEVLYRYVKTPEVKRS